MTDQIIAVRSEVPEIAAFAGKPGHYRVRSVFYQGRDVTDTKLGHLLNLQPETLQH